MASAAGLGPGQIEQIVIEPLQQFAIVRDDMGEFLRAVGRQVAGFQHPWKYR